MTYLQFIATAVNSLLCWLEALPYPVVALCVLFTLTVLLVLLLKGVGRVLRRRRRHREATVSTVEVSLPPILPHPPPAAGTPPLLSTTISGDVPPEVIVVISAAVHDWIEAGAHIVSIMPLERVPEQVNHVQAWSIEGRREHFASHKVRQHSSRAESGD